MKRLSLILTAALIIITVTSPSKTLAADWKTLRAGDTGHEVYALKLLLRARGIDPGEINTYFDDVTREALEFFQNQSGLQPDGKCGSATWGKLVAQPDGFRDAWDGIRDIEDAVPYDESPNGRNDAVKAAQYLLRNKYGFSSLTCDGGFSAATKAAVLLFQFNHGLGINGVDGSLRPKTWARLIGDSWKVHDYGWVICILFPKNRGELGTLTAFDAGGNKLLEMPCLGQSMTMNPDWREEYADTPLGCFRAGISHRSRDASEYGAHSCIELNDADVAAVTHGRDRILIHSGTNQYKDKADHKLPHKYRDSRAKTIGGLDQTHGCVRISEADHASLYYSLKDRGKGLVWIGDGGCDE